VAHENIPGYEGVFPKAKTLSEEYLSITDVSKILKMSRIGVFKKI
jgi:hypothetical protein